MWTPEEALIAKSHSDEYIEFVEQFDSSDEFLYECAGKGIPQLLSSQARQSAMPWRASWTSWGRQRTLWRPP